MVNYARSVGKRFVIFFVWFGSADKYAHIKRKFPAACGLQAASVGAVNRLVQFKLLLGLERKMLAKAGGLRNGPR